jgi:hypothetical protein
MAITPEFGLKLARWHSRFDVRASAPKRHSGALTEEPHNVDGVPIEKRY